MTVAGTAPCFAHVVNPVMVPASSDLHIAQPITFESMRIARGFAAGQGLNVEQLAVVYPEDRVMVPDHFQTCAPLDRSILDFGRFSRERQLPLFRDIFERALDESSAETIIYTNADIALMPHFYVTVAALMTPGLEAMTICRRTLADTYSSVDELPRMYADFGENHPGTDCFILSRGLVEKLCLENIAIGAQFFAFALRINMHVFTTQVVEHPRLHMTFHIGDERVWTTQDEFSRYNLLEMERMFDTIDRSGHVVNPDARKRFHAEYLQRRNRWSERRNIPV